MIARRMQIHYNMTPLNPFGVWIVHELNDFNPLRMQPEIATHVILWFGGPMSFLFAPHCLTKNADPSSPNRIVLFDSGDHG